jgi:hypothetical protein
MDRLEKSLDIFETDEHTGIAVVAQPPSTIEQDVSRIIIPCVCMILIDGNENITFYEQYLLNMHRCMFRVLIVGV